MTTNTNAASVPGPEDQKFNAWYESKFKPAVERGPLDKYVARQAWFAALSAAQPPAKLPEPDAWRYQTANGTYRYRGPHPTFGADYSLLRPIALYTADSIELILDSDRMARVDPMEVEMQSQTMAEFLRQPDEVMRPFYEEALRETDKAQQEILDAAAHKEQSPAGWVTVPMEPTEEMIAHAHQACDGTYAGDVYRAMLAAAPKAQPPAVVGEKFQRAWLQLDELPGGMMIGPNGRFGPIPSSTSAWITTSERERDRRLAEGTTMLEVWLAAAPKPHVQIPSENEHIVSDVSRKAEKIDTSAAPKTAKAEPVQPEREPLIARALAEWHEDDGPVMWWAWCGRGWAGEPAWCGTPNDSDWPGYHTHWTPHPDQPAGWAMEAHQLADALPIAGKNEDVYRWALDAASLLNKLRVLKTEREPLTERQIVKCLQESSCIGTVKMSFESGPYDIDRPSINATRLVDAIEREHGIQPAHKEQS